RGADLGGHAARPAVEVEDERAGDGGEGAEDLAGLASELAAGRLLNGPLARLLRHGDEAPLGGEGLLSERAVEGLGAAADVADAPERPQRIGREGVGRGGGVAVGAHRQYPWWSAIRARTNRSVTPAGSFLDSSWRCRYASAL